MTDAWGGAWGAGCWLDGAWGGDLVAGSRREVVRLRSALASVVQMQSAVG